MKKKNLKRNQLFKIAAGGTDRKEERSKKRVQGGRMVWWKIKGRTEKRNSEAKRISGLKKKKIPKEGMSRKRESERKNIK